MRRGVTLSLALAVLGGVIAWAEGPDSDRKETPAAFAPFEHLIGGWKGVGIPEANRLKGWRETHMWAWCFVDGQPVGMSVTFEADKILSEAKLDYDPSSKQYTLSGKDTDGKPVRYVGKLDDEGDTLTLDRVGKLPDGSQQRLIMRLNSNMIRYQILVEVQEPRAPQYARFMDINMGKQGESFAAGGGASNLPKCILTGGAATMTVSYQGKSFPICCTGCRDEFNANPEKYVKKAGPPRGGGRESLHQARFPCLASQGRRRIRRPTRWLVQPEGGDAR